MKTTTILSDTACHRLIALISVKRLRLAAAGALLAVCTTFSTNAQTTATTVPVGFIAERTVQLFSAPFTTAQRQALHAQNFYSLPAGARPVYLHSVAYVVGYAVASGGKLPTSANIAESIANLGGSGMDGFLTAPTLSPEVSQPLSAFLPIVHNTLQQLNTLISTQVANNTSYQQAMYAGTLYGLCNAYLSNGGAFPD